MADEHDKADADRAVDLLALNKQLQVENENLKRLLTNIGYQLNNQSNIDLVKYEIKQALNGE